EYDHREVIARLEPRYADEGEIARDLASVADPLRHFQEFFSRATERWAGGEHDSEYTEPWPRFRERVLAGFDELTSLVSRAGTALVFTSGGPIAVLAAHLLGVDSARAFSLQWRFVNAGVTKVVTGRNGPAVVSLNEHAHLETRGREFVTYR
ncbi:MAG: histidine phosphatase family protein, partial [Deltaproteobacteria bacterium]|nr:histidine phosphatase family protein [Deltaproteobacteria bacterium]